MHLFDQFVQWVSGEWWTYPLVIVCAAAGAIVGDNICYGLGYWLGEERATALFARNQKTRSAFEWASRQVQERGFYLIIVGRFIPGGRTAVTFSCGFTHAMRWRRFIVADVIAGVLWASYAALLGYWGGKRFEDQPWKGLLIAFAIAVSATLVIELARRLRAKWA